MSWVRLHNVGKTWSSWQEPCSTTTLSTTGLASNPDLLGESSTWRWNNTFLFGVECCIWYCSVYFDWGFLNLTEVFLTLTEIFLCFFLSCKANARVKLTKMGHGPHSSTLVVICVVWLLFALFYVLFVCKCVLYYCHWVTTQLQLTNMSYHISCYWSS